MDQDGGLLTYLVKWWLRRTDPSWCAGVLIDPSMEWNWIAVFFMAQWGTQESTRTYLLSICYSSYLPIYLSTYLPIYTDLIWFHLSTYLPLPTYLSIHLLSTYFSLYLHFKFSLEVPQSDCFCGAITTNTRMVTAQNPKSHAKLRTREYLETLSLELRAVLRKSSAGCTDTSTWSLTEQTIADLVASGRVLQHQRHKQHEEKAAQLEEMSARMSPKHTRPASHSGMTPEPWWFDYSWVTVATVTTYWPIVIVCYVFLGPALMNR